MSKLIVEVCRVDKIEPHPNAERMKIAWVKGWQTFINHDPETNITQFKEGDLCIYFPPDAILPKKIYDDRLGKGKYLHELPKDEFGIRPEGRRVVATRLRGLPSYGIITNIDPQWGDDPNWKLGTDLADHFGITKYEPPLETVEGDAARPNIRFYAYTSIENFGNYPKAFSIGEEVIMTEKIHGKNCRIGLVWDTDDTGNSCWTWMAGSHGVRRKEYINVQQRFKVQELIEQGLFTNTPKVGDVFSIYDKYWQVEYIVEPSEKSLEQVLKVHVFEVTENKEPVLKRSEYWEPLTENMKDMILFIRDKVCIEKIKESMHSIIVYGEIFGNVQDMKYGMPNSKSFRAFDIAVNNKYLDFDMQIKLFEKFDIKSVPILYRGPFSIEKLQEYTSGPTTVCGPEVAGSFKGREGVVVKPVKETDLCSTLGGRKIVKSISVDYLSRRNGTEFH